MLRKMQNPPREHIPFGVGETAAWRNVHGIPEGVMGVMGTKRGEAEVEMKLGRQKMKVRKELLAGQDDGEKSWHQGARAYKSSAWLGQKAEGRQSCGRQLQTQLIQPSLQN